MMANMPGDIGTFAIFLRAIGVLFDNADEDDRD